MRFGQIAGNNSINAAIYRCFEYLREEDILSFVRKFKEQLSDEQQVMHTFRELLLGGFLGSRGFKLYYNQNIHGRTPDWMIVDERSAPQCIVELTNFHIDQPTEKAIHSALDSGRMWVGFMDSRTDRLYDRLRGKAATYKSLAEQLALPYIVSIFGQFTAAVQLDEVRECLLAGDSSLFNLYPHVSGVLFFVDNGGRYFFRYLPNELTHRRFVVPDGVF